MTKRVSLSRLLLECRKGKRRLRSLSRRKRDAKMKKLLPPPFLPHPKSLKKKETPLLLLLWRR